MYQLRLGGRSRRRATGFTLIELLIVIAIIAILALIAIPNFLEAQVRSKVSRAHSDMRSLATACEAYFVDNNTYTWTATDGSGCEDGGNPMWNPPRNGFGPYRGLTTPVAYITTIPKDPFFIETWDGNGQLIPQFYLFYSGNVTENIHDPMLTYVIVSKGPDTSTDIYSLLPKDGGNLHCLDINYINNDETQGLPYDPTNGTVSIGDIYRLSSAEWVDRFYLYDSPTNRCSY